MVVVGEDRVTAPVTAKVPVAVKLPLTVNPAKVGEEVVIRFWLMEELARRFRVLELPLMVTWEMVDVEMVEVIILLVPVRVVLPPWMFKVLPLPFKVVLLLTVKVLEPKVKVPVPPVKVKPLTVVKEGVVVAFRVTVPPEPKVRVPPPVRLEPAVTVIWVLPWTAVLMVEP